MNVNVLSSRPLIAAALIGDLKNYGASTRTLVVNNTKQVLQQVATLAEDEVILIDLVRLPEGLRLVSAISTQSQAKIIVLVGQASDLLGQKLRALGVHAALAEDDLAVTLHRLLGQVRQGGFLRGESFNKTANLLAMLTHRQQQVLDLVLAGRSDAQIGEVLQISASTAETHRRDLQRKLGVHSHQEIVLHALRHGYADAIHLPLNRTERQVSRQRVATV